MRRFTWAISYLAGGAALGCISAAMLIHSAGVEPVDEDPPWLSRGESLASQQSFYVRAHYMMEGRLPPAPGQLIEATAETDGDGRPLTNNCIYKLSSSGPLPAWWSLSVIGGEGKMGPLQSTADRDSVVHDANGGVTITASSSPQPGNWLRTPDKRRFTLLYSAASSSVTAAAPPFTITREGCP